MKKLILTFCVFLLSLIAIAQPTISSSVLATELVCIGSPIRYQVDFPTGLAFKDTSTIINSIDQIGHGAAFIFCYLFF